ncbi:DNA polymerase III epsilon subunit-like exonuclease [Novymonas esmeraldas]|uniref:DNA polymerase III epsilon subunit-like exonuclease n=1 Tax=Novymonas esmeraldas TaxID=1808958 RepID=A0AAW0F6Y1_9TRYP
MEGRVNCFHGYRQQKRSSHGTTAAKRPRSGGALTAVVSVWAAPREAVAPVEAGAAGHCRVSSRRRSRSSSSRAAVAAPPPPPPHACITEGALSSCYAPVSPKLCPLLASTIGRLSPWRSGAAALVADASSCPPACVHAGPQTAAFSCVVVDLETTGFSASTDEILEIGCVELRWTPASHLPTTPESSAEPPGSRGVVEGLWTRGGRVFHRYVRPSRPRAVPAAATAVHGITLQSVQHCDSWSVVAGELVAYLSQITAAAVAAVSPRPTTHTGVGASRVVHLPPLVAHNASFDARFLEQHLRRCGYDPVWHPQFPLTCTLQWARVAYPHVGKNLDAVCAFLRIDGAASRAAGVHGALTDATLTALLFLRLCCSWTERFGGC